MLRIAAALTITLLPALAHAHEGLHHLLGFAHGPTTVSPLAMDLTGGLLVAGGLLLAYRFWRRPAALRVAAVVLLAAGTGLLAA